MGFRKVALTDRAAQRAFGIECCSSMNNEQNSVDWALLSRAYEGDDEAFKLLHRKHNLQLIHHALRFLGNDNDAEDAAQMTWISLLRVRITQREPRETVSAWLYRVCRSKCMDILRKRKPEKSANGSDEFDDDFDPLEIDIQSALRDEYKSIFSLHNGHEAIEHALDLAKVKACCAQLDPRERMVIHLRYFQETTSTNEEIASILQVNPPQASKIHSRAIAKLQRSLGLPLNDNQRDQHQNSRNKGE